MLFCVLTDIPTDPMSFIFIIISQSFCIDNKVRDHHNLQIYMYCHYN